jgi:hypothetical protein
VAGVFGAAVIYGQIALVTDIGDYVRRTILTMVAFALVGIAVNLTVLSRVARRRVTRLRVATVVAASLSILTFIGVLIYMARVLFL